MSQASDRPAWAGMYLDDVIVHIGKFVSQRATVEDPLAHMQDFAIFIPMYWDDAPEYPVLAETSHRWGAGQCQNIITDIPWLATFTSQNSELSPAMKALAEAPNDCTRQLARFITLLVNNIIMTEWKLKALPEIRSNGLPRCPLLEYTARHISAYIIRQCERQHMIVRSLWQSLNTAAKACSLHKDYRTTASKVESFCICAGCLKTTQDPLENVQLLREHLASRSSGLREAELCREIGNLRTETQVQQKIITNLTFRHLLENLPPAAAKSKSATTRWTDFFKMTLSKARSSSLAGSRNHPFEALLQKYKNTAQIEAVGAGLYGTLSTNIHHFGGQYTISSSQWNALEFDILRALTPLPGNVNAGEVDWQKERQRY